MINVGLITENDEGNLASPKKNIRGQTAGKPLTLADCCNVKSTCTCVCFLFSSEIDIALSLIVSQHLTVFFKLDEQHFTVS